MKTLLSIFFVLLTLPLDADEQAIISLSPGDQFSNELVAAINSVNEGQSNVIKFAPGRFEIKHPLEFRLPFGHPGLLLQGAGPGLTQLIFHTTDAGIRAHLDTGMAAMQPNPSFLVENLSLIATGRCGTAIEIRPGDPDHRGGVAPKVFRNLTIEGSKGSWTAGITADDLAFCSFRDLTLRLPKNASTGIHLTGKNAPVDHHFDGIRILGGHTGIRVTGTVEGVYLTQITMIGTDTGIDWDTTGHEPLLSLSGSHINARSCCLRANKLLQPLIIGNLFYQADPESPWTGILFRTEKATPFDLFQISNNTFHGHPKHSEPNTGISISAASSGVLQGNIFSALDTGIRLGEHATELTPTNSAFKNTATEISR